MFKVAIVQQGGILKATNMCNQSSYKVARIYIKSNNKAIVILKIIIITIANNRGVSQKKDNNYSNIIVYN